MCWYGNRCWKHLPNAKKNIQKPAEKMGQIHFSWFLVFSFWFILNIWFGRILSPQGQRWLAVSVLRASNVPPFDESSSNEPMPKGNLPNSKQCDEWVCPKSSKAARTSFTFGAGLRHHHAPHLLDRFNTQRTPTSNRRLERLYCSRHEAHYLRQRDDDDDDDDGYKDG